MALGRYRQTDHEAAMKLQTSRQMLIDAYL